MRNSRASTPRPIKDKFYVFHFTSNQGISDIFKRQIIPINDIINGHASGEITKVANFFSTFDEP